MNINTSYAAGRLTIFLAGELDHHEARNAIRTIEELLDEYMPRDWGGRAWIENPAKQPQRVIDAAGIDRLVPVALGK